MTDIYDEFQPSVFLMRIVRYNTAADNFRLGYDADTAFFASNRGRMMYLRWAFEGEFDPPNAPKTADWLKAPLFWVASIRLAHGVYLTMPMYRGSSFFQEPLETDEQVRSVIAEMQQRRGWNQEQWDRFEQRVGQANSAMSAAMNSNANQKAN